MSNLANVQKLHYCDKKSGNSSSCACIATYQIKMKSIKDDSFTSQTRYGYRCEKHKKSSTVNWKVIEANPFDQSYALTKINQFLTSLIGKNIKSTAHTARELEVKYLKENGGVMCYQNHYKKWKFVYYNQIQEILTHQP